MELEITPTKPSGKKPKKDKPVQKKEDKQKSSFFGGLFAKKGLETEEVKQISLSEDNYDVSNYSHSNFKTEKEFRSILEITDVKAILYAVPGQPIAIANGYSGYLQILEVHGKDIASLSEYDKNKAAVDFTYWLSGTMFDLNIQVTKLPTKVTEQLDELFRVLEEVRYELLDPSLSNLKRYQLRQREDILVSNIIQLEIVAAFQYNTEFFIWIFADSLEELQSNVRVAQTLTRGFSPVDISVEKKEALLKQFYNYKDPV